MNNSVIQESCVLPSHGRIYNCEVDENITLRSMTTEDEMRRLSRTDTPYKVLCKLIDSCMETDCGISSYDMCLGDYQFLLYKLRTVTYGPEYVNSSFCPFCGNENVTKWNLDELEVNEYIDDKANDIEVTLPVSNKVVTLRYTTPRDLDEIEQQKAEFMKANPEADIDISLLLGLKHNIKLIDGNHYDFAKLDTFLRKLPMRDTNILLQSVTKLNDGIGVNTVLDEQCKNPKCELTYKTTFRIAPEFFRPKI